MHADQTEHRVRPRDLGRRFVLYKVIPALQAEGYEVVSTQLSNPSLVVNVIRSAANAVETQSVSILGKDTMTNSGV